MDNEKISRAKALPGFLICLAVAAAVYILMTLLQPHLSPAGGTLFGWNWLDLAGGCAEGSLFYRFMWLLIDLDQGTFMASILGTVFLLVGLAIATHLEKKGSPHMGTGVFGASPIIFRMVLCAIAGLILGQIVNDICGLIVGTNPFATYGWVPTFAIFLSAQVLVAFYGVTPAKMITITILASIITYLCCWFFLHFVVLPLGLPLFCAVSFGLIAAVPICSEIIRLLPWTRPEKAPAEAADAVEAAAETVEEAAAEAPAEAPAAPAAPSETKWFIHQTFSDVGQLVVWGSSIAIMLMYVGSIINWIINPMNPGYSMGNFPMMIASQIATAALAIFIYYPRWKKNGFTFTFGGIVFSSAIIITYPNHWLIVALAIILGAVVLGPFIDWIMKTFNKNNRYHALFFVQIGIGLCVFAFSMIVKHVLMPALGLV